MKKKYFVFQYFIEGLVLATAATGYIPLAVFLPVLAGMYVAAYRRDGLQASALWYVPLSVCLFVGRAMEIGDIDTYVCVAIVILQYMDGGIYLLPESTKLAGFRKHIEGKQEYYEFYPIEGQGRKSQIDWNQGKAFEKVVQSKQATGILKMYYQMTLSYIARMKIAVAEGKEKKTSSGMAFCHGRDAAPLWYSSLFVHFVSNDVKVIARQHPDLASIASADKAETKRIREKELEAISEEYYQTICRLNTQKIVLVGHSYGCAAVLQAYFTHQQLRDSVSHIILMDPYLFPLPDRLLTTSIACPTLVLSNQYLLNFQDIHTRLQTFIDRKNLQCVTWKEGADLYQTDLCCFLPTNQNWQVKFKLNFQAINTFMKGNQVQGALGDNDLGRRYKPSSFLPEKYFVF